jgi:hypothetical protein
VLTPEIISKHLCSEEAVRKAALLTFLDPLPEECSRLQELSEREWSRLLRWLHISGLALYLLDRVIDRQIVDWLPPHVFERLQHNLLDNTRRTHSMIAESVAIQREFQATNVLYANLKGLSYWPVSVRRPELRSQFDLDFLVAEASAPAARDILEKRGYRLYAVSGRSWEFKRNEKPGISLKNLYKDTPSRAVELHLEPQSAPRSPLQRIEWRELYGVRMPVLSPVDLFLGQALHAHKHICSEFSRAAHLLEFRWHVLARYDDSSFWNELRSRANEDLRARLGLGVVILLITEIMGDFAPEALMSWTVRSLPPSAELWVKMYGSRAALGSFPGSKLYLLLQSELEAAGVAPKRTLREALLPSRLPPPVVRAFPNESFSTQLRRYGVQLHFVFSRLHFHLIEGVRYASQSRRWRQQLDRMAR